MAYELVIERITARRRALGLSERKMLSQANLGEKSIYHLRRGHAPKPSTLAKLEALLGLPPAFLLDAAGGKRPQSSKDHHGVAVETIFVKGAIQAGIWRSALEWEPGDWYAIHIPTSRKFPHSERFGLEVRGSSMDMHYPEGTVVMVVKFDSIARGPVPGEHVVVLRRERSSDEFEATLKEYQRDASGRHLLWPRSTDPEYQVPIVLAPDALPLSDGSEGLPHVAASSDLHLAGEADLLISALVVGVYREL